jgi:hypothetical protein
MGNIITASGTEININGACLTKAGNSVTGQVDVEVVELFERGNMLLTNKATMGRNAMGDKEIMKSGGEFYINATQNGEQLAIGCNFEVIIPADLTGPPDAVMLLWEGQIGEDCDTEIKCDDVTWEPLLDGEERQVGVAIGTSITQGPAYQAFFSDFGWTNVDRFWSDLRPKTSLLVAVPDGYTNENSAVYISYDGEAAALGFLDQYDDVQEVFSEHYGRIPVGLECHLLFVSESNGD